MTKASILILFFTIVALPFSSCFHFEKTNSILEKYDVTQEEKIWLKEFFRDLLFESPGAYTLYGTKPMSMSCLDHFTREEKEKGYEKYLSLSDDEKAKCIFPRYDFTANYEKWEKIKDRFPITKYLIGVFPSPYEKRAELVLFVNIELMLKTLLNHYEDFRYLLGTDFDPLKAVFEVEDRNSQFWNDVLKQHTLLGILLGFGRSNSWFYMWDERCEQEQKKIKAFFQSLSVKRPEEKYIANYGPQNFLLPIFGHYGLHADEALIENYKKERTKIKALYRGRDEVDLALEWLTR